MLPSSNRSDIMEKTTRTLRLDKDLDEHLIALAAADRRSLNNMVEYLIVAECRRRESPPARK